MKKIALVLDTDPKQGGGHQYAILLAECIYKNYKVTAICKNQFWAKWCKRHSIKYIKQNLSEYDCNEMELWLKAPTLIKYFYLYTTEIGDFLRKEKVNLLVFTQQGTRFPPLPYKMIYPVHDLMHRYERNFPEVKQEYNYREILLQYVSKYCSCILTDSNMGKLQYIESYRKYFNKTLKLYSLPFVASSHIWKENEEYIEVPDRYIFYPAQFWKHKNHLNLLKAIELLKPRISEIKLILVGSEKNSLREVKDYIKLHNLKNQVLIYGFVSDGNITYLYRHAIMMIMPTYFGPTNIPPLEAMALGCPVAVSDNYAMKEQIGDAGLTFSPDSPEEIAECIYKLWTNEDLRVEMIQKGYERTKKWNKDKFEDRLLKIIELGVNS